MEMNRLPVLSDLFENQRRPSRSAFKFSVVLLLLLPFERNVRRSRTQHFNTDARGLKRYILDLCKARVTILLHLRPTHRDRTVIVEKKGSVTLVVNAHQLFGIYLFDPVDKTFKRVPHGFRRVGLPTGRGLLSQSETREQHQRSKRN